MIKILKASAGSGKTFALANYYLALLTERYAYRHILAVTFTNKATAEMKSRILKFLATSKDSRNQEMLRDILHDYSAFAVSTIDKFFQQALKAFAREIGQVADYQIDLDKDALIREAMDSLLDSLTADDSEVLDWLRRSVSEDLEQGKRLSIEKNLYEMGSHLMMSGAGDTSELKKRFSKKALAAIRGNCEKIISDFTKDVNEAAKLVEVSGKNATEQLPAYQKGFGTWEAIPYPKASLMKEADGSRFRELFESERYRWYNTAWMLRDMAFSLGIAGEFYNAFERLLKEKNVMVLDESNTILKDIIAGSDAPFVYEKMGVRFEHFLLDEFQDTSNIQWENFRPLLRESEAGGHDNLIVGDVKQSIYRWRDSDWTLLGSRVSEDFPRAKVEEMQNNWRSCREIVDFNNSFFSFAARAIGREDLYSDVCQDVRSKDPQSGQVRVSFCDKADEISKVLESVREARGAGADYGDIAIAVRANAEGAAIAEALIAEGIPVVSDDSLSVKSSVTVRKLTGILANHENPDDKINQYLAEAENVEFPEEYHSLTDLCENLLRQLQAASPEEFAGETLYIQAFMDELREWVDANGNELRYFLQHWSESKNTINSPAGTSAVRVITIHKAKGLEFPWLIFPFAEKVEFFKENLRWCKLETEGTPFIPEAAGAYPVKLTKKIADTLFAPSLQKEQEMQKVDNINVFYVALTRAEKHLHVISALPSKAFRESKNPEYKDFSQLLYTFCGRLDEYSKGEPYDFGVMERREKEDELDFPYSYISIPIADRLKVSADASDFFGEDGAVGAAASARRNGIVLHGILSKVQTSEDLREAVDDAIIDGSLSPAEGEDAFALLSARIASHPEWFAGRGLNETTVIDAFGNQKRPDRVVVKDREIIVIDYKFGEGTPESDERYGRQVSGYMKIFRALGYEKVSGAVWYVVSDKLVTL